MCLGNIEVLYEDNHLLVVVKPPLMPVMDDESKDKSLLNILKDEIKVRDEKRGNVYLGLVHRLDRPTGGVMVFAKTSKSASRLSEQIRTRSVEKKYLAVCNSSPVKKEDTLKANLLDLDGRVIVSPKGKASSLSYSVLAEKDNKSLLSVELHTGRKHQIRVMLSNIGIPIVGDAKYGREKGLSKTLGLWAYSLSFKHPTLKEKLTFTKVPSIQPFADFKSILDSL